MPGNKALMTTTCLYIAYRIARAYKRLCVETVLQQNMCQKWYSKACAKLAINIVRWRTSHISCRANLAHIVPNYETQSICQACVIVL